MSAEQYEDILRIKGVKSQGYGIIPKIAMRDARLPMESKAIYAYICSFAGSGDTAFPGVELMVSELGTSQKRFYRYRKILIDLGYLSITRERNGQRWGRNIYELCDKPSNKPDEKNENSENTDKNSQHGQFERVQNERMQFERMQNDQAIINRLNINSININRDNNKNICVETEVSTEQKTIEQKPVKKKEEKTFDKNGVEYQASKYLAGKILEKNPNAKVPVTDAGLFKWCVHIDYILRIDKKPLDEFKKVLQFAVTDAFWSANILSTANLREKYDRLFAKMNMQQQNNRKAEEAAGNGNGVNGTGYNKAAATTSSQPRTSFARVIGKKQ